MDIVTLGAALNGSAEYVNSHFVGGSNIQIVDNPDGTQTINASGEVSAEDTVARAEIAEIKDGETLDSFGDVETALADKVDKETGKGLSTNDYTTAEKTKLAGIEAQANKTTVDDALSGSSTNPVQNKVVKSALDSKANISDIPTVPITAIQKNGTDITPVSGTVNIAVPTQASDINAATATQGGKADTAIQGVKVNSSTVNPDSNKVVSITVPTTAADVSALPNTTKYAAALSLTINSSTYVMTGQLKDQNGDNLGTAQTIDLPLESVVVGGSYNSQTKKVVLTLQNGNTIEFSVADLVSGLQTELSASNKLNPAYINYDSTHRAVSDTEKSMWNSKQNALSSTQLDAVNSGVDSKKVAQIETNKNNIADIKDGTNIDSFGDVETAFADKVDKVSGKGLSTNDFTNTDKENLTTALNKANAAAPQSTTYTKSEVDSALAAKLNKSDVDSTLNSTSINPVQNKVIQAPLARLVDAGAKNLCSVDSVSAPDGIGFTRIHRFNSVIPAGKYTVSFDGTISDSVSFSLVDTNDNRITESQFTFNQLSLPIVREISISVASTGIQFYKNSAISFSNIMICTAEDYAISPEFVPYAMSNAELTALVLKVASGTYSLNDLTWTTSVDGIIYSNATVVNGITNIYSVIITGFGRLRATDVIVPILSNDGTQIRFMANTNSWVTDAYVTLRIVGI